MTMAKLNLSVAIGDYDRNRPLIDGAVQIDGVDPVFMTLVPEEIFFRAFRAAEFDICELSLSSYHGEDRAGQLPLCRGAGLRVAHVPPHLDLCAHRPHQEAGGSQGQEGRRAGISADRECVGARVPGGRLRRQAFGHPLDQRRHRGAGPAGKDHDQPAAGVRLDNAPEGATISGMLEEGEIDGFMAPRAADADSARAIRISAGCFPIRSRSPRIITSARGFFRSCM